MTETYSIHEYEIQRRVYRRGRNAPRTRTYYAVLRPPNRRAGRNKIERTSAKRASKVIPTRRKGSDTIQMNGNSTSTRSASGHETTKSRHQTRKASRVFTWLAFHSRIKRQAGAAAITQLSITRRRRLQHSPEFPVVEFTGLASFPANDSYVDPIITIFKFIFSDRRQAREEKSRLKACRALSNTPWQLFLCRDLVVHVAEDFPRSIRLLLPDKQILAPEVD